MYVASWYRVLVSICTITKWPSTGIKLELEAKKSHGLESHALEQFGQDKKFCCCWAFIY